jgi:LL-diaminopimelate aminotransferase
MKIELSDRLKNLPPYLFAKIDQMKNEIKKRGVDLIDFGVGDPDLPTPQFILDALKDGLTQSQYHRYPPYAGTEEFRLEIAEWFFKRFQVRLDPNKEILVLIGSKEGIGHLPLSLVNPHDGVLYTTPGYPVYKAATQFAAGIPIPVPLKLENNFLPDLPSLERGAKLFYFNYPNNPTSATASLSFFDQVVHWANKTETILCHDAAYSEIYLSHEPSPSILQIPGAKDAAIEFHSLSKTFNMTGWRIGFAAGNEKLIEALGKLKTNLDSGQFKAIQHAAKIALKEGNDFVVSQRQIIRKRRDALLTVLKNMGIEYFEPKATFYVWAKTPKSTPSIDFCSELLMKYGIVTTPGIGFGEEGEGFFRFSLTVSEEKINEAANRLYRHRL